MAKGEAEKAGWGDWGVGRIMLVSHNTVKPLLEDFSQTQKRVLKEVVKTRSKKGGHW